MEKIALIYSFTSTKTAQIARKVKEKLGDRIIEVDTEAISSETFKAYKHFICGVPTWFDGELPNYWDEFIPELETLNLDGKKVALYGLGDQKGYPENFGDAVGLLSEVLEYTGATIIGKTSTEGYEFESSRAQETDQFKGLILDFENQHLLNETRLNDWIDKLKKEF